MTQTTRPKHPPDFLLLCAGQVVSHLGSGLTAFVLGLWVFSLHKSVTEFAFIEVCATLPGIVIVPAFGVFLDRWDRRRTLICANVIGAAVALALALLMWRGVLQLWEIFLGVLVISCAAYVHEVASQAFVSQLVPEEELSRANGLIQLAPAGQIAAPLLAAFLLQHASAPLLLALDCVSFLFAAATIWAISAPRAPAKASDKPSLWESLTTGYAFLVLRGDLKAQLILSMSFNVAMRMSQVLLTPMVLKQSSPQALGTVLFCGGAGMVLGGLAVSAWRGPRSRVHGVLVSAALTGACFVIAGLRPSLHVIMAGTFGVAFFSAFYSAFAQAIWQSQVPMELQGRVMALKFAVLECGIPLGYLAAGPLADQCFEPLLLSDGALASSLGVLLGVGPGRGMGLLIAAVGLAFMAATLVAALYRPFRTMERAAAPVSA